ncbi:MAG TPA: hypothetical protein VHD55_00685 [Candidatus Paceibacterota bacterium]|nr:hypothetical protein [Candidatus Paceibacterota bacterium]
MNELVHADIFFFITSVAVIALSAAMLVLLLYLIPAARDLRSITAKVRKAGDEMEKDFEDLRANLRAEGSKGKMLVDIVLGWAGHVLKAPAARRAKKQPPSSEV